MGDFKWIDLEIRENGIAILTMNRPDAMNAFNWDLCPEMVEAYKIVEERDDIKVLVLTGAGKGFSAGGDISLLFSMQTPAEAKVTYDISTAVIKGLYDIKKPVICAVNGPVAGASTALMMACDLIIASENAKFGFTFSKIAFCPDSGCSYFLTRKVGYHKAAEILWYGKLLSSQEALDLGLVNTLVPEGQALSEAINWAERLIQMPLMTIGYDKKLLRESMKNDFYQQAELESMYQILMWSSDDFKEGCMAFAEKRKPNFKGK
ncbi:MAG: enoyl-CoA hydratase [Syntrophomonadaceae bacterium]|nr:enoyl-CoA hydratase [Syntrophomonadaceae bacterium]